MSIRKFVGIAVFPVLFACLRQNLSAAWVTSTVDSLPSGDVGNYCSLAIDQNNNPHIAYYDATAKRPKHAKWDGSAWVVETIPVSFTADTIYDCGQYASLAIDASGNIHVSCYATDTVNSYMIYAKGTQTSSITTWASHTLKTETLANFCGMYSSIALNSSGNPSVVFSWETAFTYCFNSSDGGGTWAFLSSFNTGGSCWNSLAIDKSTGLKHVACLVSTNGAFHSAILQYSQCSAAAFSSPASIDTPNQSSSLVHPLSISLNPSGIPSIAYYDDDYHHIKYAQANTATVTGQTWTSANIDSSADDTGQYSSLAIDANTVPHIAFYDATTQQLKHTQYNSASLNWSPSVVDAVRVGFCSLKPINLSGAVVKTCIAYYDSANKKLKFAIDDDAPTLTWVQQQGFINSGAKQTNSPTGVAVNYGVVYTHVDSVAPKPGYPKLHIANSANNAEISGSPFSMPVLTGSGNIVNGQQYGYDYSFSTPGTYNFWFEAYDVWGSSATGITQNRGTVTITQGASNNSTGDTTLNNARPSPSFGNISNGDKINFAGITPNADLKIYTPSGTLVKTLKADSNGVMPPWDGSIEGGGKAASGTYIVRASDGKGNKKTFKILLVK